MNKRQILAGTAIALLMAAGPAFALNLPKAMPSSAVRQQPLLLLAQDDSADQPAPQDEEQTAKKKKKKDQQQGDGQAQSDGSGQPAGEGDQRRKKHRNSEMQSQDAAPAGDNSAEGDQPRKKRRNSEAQTQDAAPQAQEPQSQEPQAQQQDAAPATDQTGGDQRRKKHRNTEAQTQDNQPAATDQSGGDGRRKKNRNVEIQTQENGAAPTDQTGVDQPRKKKRDKHQAADQQNEVQPSTTDQPAAASDQQAPADQQNGKKRRKANEAEQGGAPATETQGSQTGNSKSTDTQVVLPKSDSGQADTGGQNGDQSGQNGDQSGKRREGKRNAQGQDQNKPAGEGTEADKGSLPANAAPVLDSAKEKPAGAASGEANGKSKANANAGEADVVKPANLPKSDAAAQKERIDPTKIEKATAEQGKRIDEPDPEKRFERRERPQGADVLRTFGDRVIVKFGDNVTVESSDRPRLSRNAKDVYYEELPQGREREVIERPDGTRVVTIRNRYGDVIRRSRIMPNGREYVLNYVDERDFERVRDRRDPGDDLPPLRLAIPADDYILDSRDVRDNSGDRYYDFLDQPPVEQIQRTYSIDEVKRSARIRDTVRRIDLDTITFPFGSAEVTDDQVNKLDGVARAMEKLLKANPAETFLVEGHTDAVGSDEANLALSDRRAEAVAGALSNVFAIPPENLTTQGYGEQFLKINVQGPEERNRRVAIRRVTALVSPVANND